MEQDGHLREQGWEGWEDSMKIVNYINHPPWQSHKCRDVLQKTNQCNAAANYIIIYSFTVLVLVLIECNQKGETPGIAMQVGIQKGGSKESTGVMAKHVSKIIFKVKCYISTKAEVSHGKCVWQKWRTGNAVTPNQGTALAVGSANCWLPTPGQSGDTVWQKTSVQSESSASTERNAVSLIPSRIWVCWLVASCLLLHSSCFPFLYHLPLARGTQQWFTPTLPSSS